MTLVKWKMVYDKRGYRVKHVTFIAAPPVMEMELKIVTLIITHNYSYEEIFNPGCDRVWFSSFIILKYE